MNAIEYTKALRRLATISWVGSLVVFVGLAWLHILPFDEVVPFLALLFGTAPLAMFAFMNKVRCESCGGHMRISSGYPRIHYRCKTCGNQVDTGILSDF